MTQKEKKYILNAANEARKAKNWDLFEKIMKGLPLTPRMALVGKETFGVEYMKQCNLTLANACFGEGWLNA